MRHILLMAGAMLPLSVVVEAMAADAPDARRAVRAEACRIAAEKKVPPRIVDRAVADRERAAVIAECIAEAERANATGALR